MIEWVAGLKRALEIPTSIQAAGVPGSAFLARVDEIAESAFDDENTISNLPFPLVSEIRCLLLDGYYDTACVEPYQPDTRDVAVSQVAAMAVQ